ncbi:MAG: HlyD family efflux transporter periplasmic adaptor subunit [Eubacteriales bacterium]|nr:HlyD family efflux transporter periplasmic adaptor subunit [Eubacteriales bacterium]
MPDHKKQKPGKLTGILSGIRNIFGLNIGTVLFGVLFLYMIFSAVLYLTSVKIESYQVISGPLSRNETYTGLAIREEKTYQADSNGYVTYYAREGNKINANGAVYGVSSTKVPEAETELSQEDLAKIRSDMLSFSKGFNPSKFNNTYSFKYQLEGSILQYAGVTAEPVSSMSTEDGTDASSVNYYAATATLGNQTIRKAPADGIVLYCKDGYEGKTIDSITSEDFDQNSYHETDLKTENSVKAGDDIYTLITDERWSLLIPLSEKQAVKLADRTTIRVKFLKDDMTQSGDFSIVEIDGGKYGRIDFNKGLIRYATERFLEIELVTNTVSGLKIPLSSIVTKEFYTIPSEFSTLDEESQEVGFMMEGRDKNGEKTSIFKNISIYAKVDLSGSNAAAAEDSSDVKSSLYYVDKSEFEEGDAIISQKNQGKYIIGDIGVLEGVYCINKGYAVFRRIEILDQNEEYAIVSKNTAYGLARYDHIVKNADAVKEEDILY